MRHSSQLSQSPSAAAAAPAAVLLALIAGACQLALVAAQPVPQPSCGYAVHCTAATCGPSLAGPGVATFNLGQVTHNLTVYNGSDYELLQPAIHSDWYMNVCGYTVSHCLQAQGIVYFQNDLNAQDCHYVATGSQGMSGSWSLINAQNPMMGVTQTYADGDPAGCTGGALRSVTINYHCSPSNFFDISGAAETPIGSCQYRVDVSTFAACPRFVPDPIPPEEGGGGGISGGSVFLIIFFIGGAVYVAGGMLYRRYRTIDPDTGLPPSGVRNLCPNRDLWTALWGYTVEGCRFTYRKVMGLCGGRGGSSGVGDHPYDDIGAPTQLGDASTLHTAEPVASSLPPTQVAAAGFAANQAAAKSVSANAPPPMSPYDAHV